ncbi:MAG TPA: hypothetical protein DDW98_03285 [Gammaproteobacteria bacterium]|nr:hypothetical protein [Gammaproteobacteria bacterium]HBG51623.1 hypothetical protein [Gammaproteobacteria bacterium]
MGGCSCSGVWPIPSLQERDPFFGIGPKPDVLNGGLGLSMQVFSREAVADAFSDEKGHTKRWVRRSSFQNERRRIHISLMNKDQVCC